MHDYLAARNRPIGIILLSILHLAGGLLLFAILVAVYLLSHDDKLQEALDSVGIPLPMLLAGIGFLGLLGVASGIGMLRGKKWGWYLGSFWYAYAIIRNAAALITVYGLSAEIAAAETARGPGFYYFKFSMRIFISALILLYFFKANVRAYFGLQQTPLWKPVAVELAASLGIAVAASLGAGMLQ